MTASPSTPLRRAHSRHSRSTARVESTRTPSKSKRIPEQEKVGISDYLITVAATSRACAIHSLAWSLKEGGEINFVILSEAKDLCSCRGVHGLSLRSR